MDHVIQLNTLTIHKIVIISGGVRSVRILLRSVIWAGALKMTLVIIPLIYFKIIVEEYR